MGFFLKLVTGNDPFERCKAYVLKYGKKLGENIYDLTFHDPEGKEVSVSVLEDGIQLKVTDLKGNFFTVSKDKNLVGKGYSYIVGTPDLGAPIRSAIIKPTKVKIVSKEEAESLIEPWAKLLEKQIAGNPSTLSRRLASLPSLREESQMGRIGETVSPGDKCDILIVEDEEAFRYLIEKIIQDRFPTLKIQSVGDGLEGFEKAKVLKPRIVWTCVRLPRMDGLELIELIRQNPDLENTKIIVCTAYGSKDIKNRAFELGADKFLNKPFKIEEVLSAIDSYLLDYKVNLDKGDEMMGLFSKTASGGELFEMLRNYCLKFGVDMVLEHVIFLPYKGPQGVQVRIRFAKQIGSLLIETRNPEEGESISLVHCEGELPTGYRVNLRRLSDDSVIESKDITKEVAIEMVKPIVKAVEAIYR